MFKFNRAANIVCGLGARIRLLPLQRASMTTKPPPLAAPAHAGADSLKRLIWLRGLALLGMGAMLAAARPLFQIVVPLTAPLMVFEPVVPDFCTVRSLFKVTGPL